MAEFCPACRRSLRHVVTLGDLRLAVDPEPSTAGTVVIEQLDNGKIRGRILTGDSPEAPGDTVEAYTQHRHTCPHSSERRGDDNRPNCRACTLPMGRRSHAGDLALVRGALVVKVSGRRYREPAWSEHPSCDIPAAAAAARYALAKVRAAGVQTTIPEAS